MCGSIFASRPRLNNDYFDSFYGEIAALLRKHGGKTGEELKPKGK